MVSTHLPCGLILNLKEYFCVKCILDTCSFHFKYSSPASTLLRKTNPPVSLIHPNWFQAKCASDAYPLTEDWCHFVHICVLKCCCIWILVGYKQCGMKTDPTFSARSVLFSKRIESLFESSLVWKRVANQSHCNLFSFVQCSENELIR